MKRRNLIAGLGALTGASGLTVGSGAFSNATAQREFKVSVTRDQNARLSLSTNGGPGRGETDDLVEFDFTENQLEAGLNKDAVFQFSEEGGIHAPLFSITNNGTQPVVLSDEPVDADAEAPSIGVFQWDAEHQSDGLRPLLRNDNVILEVGEGIGAGIHIDTDGVEADNIYETSVTLHAERPDG